MTKKGRPFTLCTIAVLIGLLLGATLNFASSQSSGTQVNGIINSNRAWTKTGSPYNLTGNILVDYGVTLIVESGVTVNLNGYYIMVNGTLQAIGGTSGPTNFVGGEIIFTQNSTDWNEDTGNGCIIQNCILTSTITANNSPKLSNNVCNNAISIQTTTGMPLVAGNFLMGGLVMVGNGIITNNTVIGQGIDVFGANLIVSHNIVTECSTGIRVSTSLYNPSWHWPNLTTVIENNLITNNEKGITLDAWQMFVPCNPFVINNTITNNTIGLYLTHLFSNNAPTLLLNNIYENHNYNIKNDVPDNNVDAPYNWWGTTNTTIIDQLIYDYYDDFTLGKVNYMPTLSAPNFEVFPMIIPEIATCLITVLFLTLICAVMVTLKRKLEC
ncbi:MAG: hypothetical protein NWE95_02100 [Candidatus Bathyarchaeota archaeon]|nr:hypothetical protein [Candidatus Bathyarchaeota archaeon]